MPLKPKPKKRNSPAFVRFLREQPIVAYATIVVPILSVVGPAIGPRVAPRWPVTFWAVVALFLMPVALTMLWINLNGVHSLFGHPFTRGRSLHDLTEERFRRRKLGQLAGTFGLRIAPGFPDHAFGLYDGRTLALQLEHHGVTLTLGTTFDDYEFEIRDVGHFELSPDYRLNARDSDCFDSEQGYSFYFEVLSEAQREALLDILRESGANFHLRRGELELRIMDLKFLARHPREVLETLHEVLVSFERHNSRPPLASEVSPEHYFARKKFRHVAKGLGVQVHRDSPDRAKGYYEGRKLWLRLEQGDLDVSLMTRLRARDPEFGRTALGPERERAMLQLSSNGQAVKLTLADGKLSLQGLGLEHCANPGRVLAVLEQLHQALGALETQGSERESP